MTHFCKILFNMHIAGAEWEEMLGFWTFQGHFHWRNPEFLCMVGIICASLVLFHLLQKHSEHSAFAAQNGRNRFLFVSWNCKYCTVLMYHK